MKFNVIIPTRERPDTLYWSIKTCLTQDYDDLTIWISDNCSEDNTRNIVESFNDKRIKYIRTPKRVSMSHNWEYALSHIDDGYVTIIGDDDGLLPDAIRHITTLLNQQQLDTICWKVATYNWPSVQSDELKGELTIPIENSYVVFNSKEILKKATSDIFSSVLLPSLYWGVTHINNIRRSKKNNVFFYSQQPDVYAGAMIAANVKKYIYSNRPYSISGASHYSSGQAFLNRKFSQQSNQKFFSEPNIPFHHSLKVTRSSAILLAEPLIQASLINNNIPKPSVKRILNQSLWEAANCNDENKAEEIICVLKEIASLNNEMPFLIRLLKKYRFNNENIAKTYGIQVDTKKCILRTRCISVDGRMVDNIYMACLLTSMLLSDKSKILAKKQRF